MTRKAFLTPLVIGTVLFGVAGSGRATIYEANVRLIPDTPVVDALEWDGDGLVPGTLNLYDTSYSASDVWEPTGYTGPPLYGVTKSGPCWISLRNPGSGLDRIRLNQTNALATGPYESSGLALFRKTDFAGVYQFADRLKFSASDRLEGTFFDEVQAADGAVAVRWVVLNGTNDSAVYYISEATTTLGTVASPTVLSDAPLSLTWYAYDPGTDITSAGIGSAVTPVFDDIQYIGIHFEGSRVNDGKLTIGATDLSFDVTISNLPARLNPLPAAQDKISDGFLDVTKAPYSADDTGGTDTRQSIQDAIDDAYATNLVVFFPAGTYLCDGPLTCIQPRGPSTLSQRKFAHKLVGSTVGARPVLKLKDGADLSGQSSRFIRFAWEGDWNGDGNITEDASRHYCGLFRGIDVDMGDNPTAEGIQMHGAQYCAIEDVHVYGTNFSIGVNGLPGSGGSATNLKVTGGATGIQQGQYRPTPLLTGVELIGQSERGIQVGGCRGPLVVAGFRIVSPANPGVDYEAVHCGTNFVGGGGLNPSVGNLVMVDGTIEVSGTDGLAIYNKVQDVYLENVFIKAVNVMEAGTLDPPTDTISGSVSSWTEFVRYAFGCLQDESHLQVDGVSYNTTVGDQELAMVRTGTTPPPDLMSRHFWGSDFPSWEDSAVVRVTDAGFGATRDDDSDDDAPAIQAALDASVLVGGMHEGKTVFLPRGHYHIRSGIEVPLGASLIGAAQTISVIDVAPDWAPAAAVSAVSTEDGLGDVVLANFMIRANQAKVETGTEAQKFITHVRVRSSNTIWRNVLNRVEAGAEDGPKLQLGAFVKFDGSGGGKVYNMQVSDGGGDVANFHHLEVRDTDQPLAFYAPSIEHMNLRAAQVSVEDAGPVAFYGFKYESGAADPWILSAKGARGLYLYGGSGNYTPGQATDLISIENCVDVRIASVGRQGGADSTVLWLDGQGSLSGDRSFCYFGHLEDLDSDGVPDVWQREQFGTGLGPEDTVPAGSVATGNMDGDEWTNREEWVLGQDPMEAELVRPVSITISGNTATPAIEARAATGTGYGGVDRVFRLMHSNDLETWLPVTGADGIVGDDTMVKVPMLIEDLGTPSFFKVDVEIR